MKKDTYDLIFSLGGDCAAALNLNRLNLRFCALPFDWLFIVDDYPIKQLEACFKEDFNRFLLKENLVELKGNERGRDAKGKIQYQDAYTRYRWIHHFEKAVEEAGAYEKVKQTVDHRIRRLYKLLAQSDSVLCVLNIKFQIDIAIIQALHKTLADKFPKTTFTFNIVEFGCRQDQVLRYPAITVFQIGRNMIDEDWFKGSDAWRFLNEVQLSRTWHDPRREKYKKWLFKALLTVVPLSKWRKTIRNKYIKIN